MQILAKSIVAAVLAGLLVFGSSVVSWEVFVKFIEGRTFSGQAGLFLSQLPLVIMQFGLAVIAGGILAIITYRERPCLWALGMSVAATLVTVQMRSIIYFKSPTIIERFVHGADAYMLIPGALFGALIVGWVLRLTMVSTERKIGSDPAKLGKLRRSAG